MPAHRKKLIEVALPLDAINAASASEKSIFKSHPSALHIWWARRPLATARAVIWASLVDDPSSLPEQFPTPEAQTKERERLFGILKKLVLWESTNDALVLEEARAEIAKSTGGAPPALLDPFAGGGAIPLEAKRLGLDAHARDLNPVAVMINKAMLELPARFAGKPPVNPENGPKTKKGANDLGGWAAANGLADDVEHYGGWMKQKAFERIGHLYPKIKAPKENGGAELPVIAWLWTRTVRCPSPACAIEAPLASSWELSKKKGREAYINPVVENGHVRYEVKHGKGAPEPPKFRRGQFRCVHCKAPVSLDYIRAEFRAKRAAARMTAIVAEGPGGRVYVSPDGEHARAADVGKPDDYPTADIPDNPRAISSQQYGLTTFDMLFTNRQLTALVTFSDLVAEARAQVVKDGGGEEYALAIAVYLAFVVDKLADRHSALCSWQTAAAKIGHTFTRSAIPMIWDYAEANPFGNSSGCFDNMLEYVVRAIRSLPATHEGHTSVSQHDAQTDNGMRGVMVSTDPPYYDNIGYAELSDYFYVWLRRSLKGHFPDVFATLLAPKTEELVATPYRFDGDKTKAKAFFEDSLLETFRQIHKYSRDDVPVTVYYAYKQTEGGEEGIDDEEEKESEAQASTSSTGWETMLSALIDAGFTVTGTWPMRTERGNRVRGIGSNALASSVVIACRRRPKDAPPISRADFIRALGPELGGALEKLQAAGIAPTDFGQAAIGPGMAIYSRHSAVLDASGAAMGVRWALRTINQELDRYFSEQDGGLDAASRLCVDLFSEYAYGEMEYGRAEVAARARNVSIDALAAAGAAESAKGKVRLLRPAEAHARKPKVRGTDADGRGADGRGAGGVARAGAAGADGRGAGGTDGRGADGRGADGRGAGADGRGAARAGGRGGHHVPAWAAMQRLIHALTAEDPDTGEKKGGWEMAGREAAELDANDGMGGRTTELARALAYRMYQLADRKGMADEAVEFNQLATEWGHVQSSAAKVRESRGQQAALDLGE